MKNALLSLILVVILGCNTNSKGKQTLPTGQAGKTTTDSIPACVRQEIEAIEKKNKSNLPVQIDEYLYKGKRVFLYTADCCDQFNILYDDNCKSICAPSGGLEGGGDHKCEDFSATAKHIKVLWKNTAK